MALNKTLATEALGSATLSVKRYLVLWGKWWSLATDTSPIDALKQPLAWSKSNLLSRCFTNYHHICKRGTLQSVFLSSVYCVLRVSFNETIPLRSNQLSPRGSGDAICDVISLHAPPRTPLPR